LAGARRYFGKRDGMVCPRRLFQPIASLLLAAAVAHGAGPVLPPLAGELSGDFTPLQLAGAPTVHWTLTLRPEPGGIRVVQLTLDGPGTHLRGDARLDAAGYGSWRVTESEVDLKPWLGGQLAAGSAAVVAEGTVQAGGVSGDFNLRVRNLDLGELLRVADAEKKHFQSAQGRVEGTVQVHLRDGVWSRGEIALAIPAGTAALILLQPAPGLLSGYIPASVRRQYNGIEAIELGQTPLEARVLRLTYSPAGDAVGHNAVVHLEGQPQDRKYVAPLVLDLNFSGEVERALDGFLKMSVKLGGSK
jgi:hypothetical protein